MSLLEPQSRLVTQSWLTLIGFVSKLLISSVHKMSIGLLQAILLVDYHQGAES